MDSDSAPLIFVMGPTASGKSGLAMALAETLGAEIVSVDSAQVYRGMDIGSAKPSAAERARVPHHLLDLLDPREAYSAARFAQDASAAIADIRARGRVPLLVGGTMLYFRALQSGLSDLPSADPALRRELEAQAAREGWPALHARLAQLDPVTAARLAPRDKQRIQRALEIALLSGRPASALHAESAISAAPLGRVIKFTLTLDRAQLHVRIAQRFREMMAAGFVDEVARLRARGDLDVEMASMRAVGYRQLWKHLDGEGTLEQAVERGIAATRQLAKRQLTWLRKEPDTIALDAEAPELFARVQEHLRATAVIG